jgi:hypothetical protein
LVVVVSVSKAMLIGEIYPVSLKLEFKKNINMSRSPLSSMAKMVAIINNAITRGKAVAIIPFSHFKHQICEKLVKEQSLA